MQRGKNQVLFRYLPEAVIDHTDTGTIAKVCKWNVKKAENINTIVAFEEIKRRVFGNIKNRGFQRDLSKYIFLECSNSILVELFPLTFECRNCKKIYKFRDVQDLIKKTNNFLCSNKECHGKLEQLDLIHYHICGNIEGLRVKSCEQHDQQFILLDRKESDEPSKWIWRCGICKKDLGKVTDQYCSCNIKKNRMNTAPFRKSQVFYPQNFQLINYQTFDNSVLSNEFYHKLNLARFLDLINHDEYNRFGKFTNEDLEFKELEEKIKLLRQKNIPEEYLEEIKSTFSKDSLFSKREVIFDKITKLFGADINNISYSILNYNEIKKSESLNTIGDIIEEAKYSQNPNIYQINKYSDYLNSIGISNAYIINDLPLSYIVYGYTRDTNERDKCIICSFPHHEDYRGLTPIYVNSIETEAIILEFNRKRILQWLLKNNIIKQMPEDDGLDYKSWFLKNINPDNISYFDEISDEFPLIKNVYELIHTISHVLIKSAAPLVGLDKNSLAEIIFPQVPAIVIYSNCAYDFQLGGIHSLFENSVIPWVENSKALVETCLYDPVCMSDKGACLACQFLSEITCSHFNRNLNRSNLIGMKNINNEIIKHGFWEPEILR